MKKKILVLLLLTITILITLGGTSDTEAARICSNCQAGNHVNCPNRGYTHNSTSHSIWCCCGKTFANAEKHYNNHFLNDSTYCYICVCGYKEKHNTSGGHCSKAHCPYNSSRTLCNRGCNHAKWVNCRDHSYSSTWTRTATHHWKKCTVSSSCTAKKSYGEHELENGKCKVCEKVDDSTYTNDGGGGNAEATDPKPGAPVVNVKGINFTGTSETNVVYSNSNVSWNIETEDSVSRKPLKLTEYDLSGATTGGNAVTRAGRYNRNEAGSSIYSNSGVNSEWVSSRPATYTFETWIYLPVYGGKNYYIFHTGKKRYSQIFINKEGNLVLYNSNHKSQAYIPQSELQRLGFYSGWAYLSVQAKNDSSMSMDNVIVYVNGQQATAKSSGSRIIADMSTSRLQLGGYYSNNNVGLPDGSMMKETKIFNAGLASTSANRMYTEMNSSSANWSNLIGYWKQVETSGSTMTATAGVSGMYANNANADSARDVSSNYTSAALTNNKFTGTISAEGKTRITANHVGMLGATSETTVDVVIDKTAPTGTVFASTYNTNQNSVTLYVTASDDSGISGVNINGWYGGNWSQYNSSKSATYNNTTGQWEVTYNFSEIQNTTSGATNQGQGIYYFDAHIYDNAGNWGIASAVTVAYDTQGPTKGSVTVDGATGSYPTFYTRDIKSTVTINFTGIADNLSGISNFDYYLRRDGAARVYDYNVEQVVDENAGTGHVKYQLNGQGRYVTEIYLYDRAGNLSAYEEITIIADNEAPSLPSESVEGATLKDDGKYYVTDSTGVVTINSWNMSDNLSGLSNFDYYLRKDGASRTYAYNVAQAVDPSTGTGYVKYKFNGYGTYTTERYIYDKAGNHRPCEVKTFVVAPDKSQGVIYTSASVTNQPTITVSVAASDESSGVANVTIYGWQGTTVSGTAGAFIGGNSTYNSSTGRWEKTFTFSELPSRETGNTNQGDGIYSFDAHVINNAGTDTYIDLVSVTYDITPPKITSITYDPGWKNTSVTEEVSATDNLSGVRIIEYSYDLNSWYSDWDVTGTGYAKATWTAEGDRVLYFRATDYAGNTWVYAFDGVHPSAYDLKIDKTLPNGTVSASTTCTNQNSVTIYVNATDALSGVDHVKIMAWTGSKDWVKTNAERDTTYNTETGLWEITFTFDEIRDTTTGELNQGDGNYYFGAHIYDKAGNRRIVDGTTVIYDTTPPKITSITYDPGWKNVDITKGVEAVDALSGIKLIEYSYDLNTWYSDWEVSNKGYVRRTWTEEGDRVVYFRATDNAGNIWVYAFDGTHPSAYDLKIDKTSPVAGTYTVSGATFSDGKYYVTNNTAEITLNFTGMSDNLSGLKNFDYYLRKDGAERTYDYNVEQSITGSTGYVKYKLNGEGTYVTEIYLYDNATNLVGYDSITIVADNTPPTITSITYDPGWKNVDITKYVEATDNLSGVKLLEYSYDLNTWYSDWDSSSGGYANKTWTEEGDRVVYFRATDYAGNIGVYAYDGVNPTAYDLKIDKTIPEIGTYTVSGTTVVGGKHYVTSENAEITLNFTGMSDNLSGLKNFDYYLRKDGAERTYDYNVEQNITGSTGYVKYKLNGYGTYTTEIYLYDNATNHRGYQILTINAVESIPIPKLMEREHDKNYQYYTIGAYRADNSTTYTADKIKKITLIDLSKESAPITYVATWDASYTNGDGNVTAWLVTNAEDNTMYDLYLGAEGKIYAPSNSYRLFFDYPNCVEINGLNNLETSQVTSMSWMFQSCRKLTSLDVSNFNTSNVTNLSGMFDFCSSLTNIDVSNFNTSNATNMESMFASCSSLTSLDVSGFNTSNVTNMECMFSFCRLTSIDVRGFNTQNVTNMGRMFYGCSRLTSLDVSSFDTSNVVNMDNMFASCSKLTSLDVSKFDTSKVRTMGYMFEHCSNLKYIDLRNFDTSSLDGKTYNVGNTAIGVDVNYMFSSCTNLESVIIGDKFNRLDGYDMFKNCNKLKAIITTKAITSSSDALTLTGTENVTNSRGQIIAGPNGLIALPNAILYVPNTTSETAYEAATNYSTVFGADRIRPILELVGDNPAKVKVGETYDENVDSGVTIAGFDKANASGYTQYGYNYTVTGLPVDTTTTGTKQVTYTLTKTENGATTNGMSVTRDVNVVGMPKLMEREGSEYVSGKYVYYAIGAKRSNNKTYTADLINSITFVNNVNVPNEAEASWDASYTNGDNEVIAWVIPNTTDSTKYDLYIGADDITIVAPANSNGLFREYKNCTAINNLTMLDTSNVTNMSSMFYNCSSLPSLEVSNFDTSQVTDMRVMFYSCSSLPSLEVSNFDTSQVTDMHGMFYGCSSLTSLEVSNFDTSKVTNMSNMFCWCWSLISLDVSNFNTSKVTNMSYMFSHCESLPSLDVSNFNTSNVTNMSYMFYYCSSFPSLDVSNFDTSKVTNMSYMFSGCSSLTSLEVSNFDTSKVTNMYMMFYRCSSLPSLDVSNFNTGKVTNMSYMFYNCSILTSLKLGTNFDRLTGTSMFDACSKLKAIITPRDSIMTLNDNATTSTGLKILTNTILYVSNPTVEATFEADANYADIFGADRIKPILELVGETPAKITAGDTYVDAGVTVAGMTQNAADTTYTPYGYTVSGPVIKKDGTVVSSIDTSNVGTYTLTYTVHEPNSSVDGMSVTREVEIESKDISENNPDITVSIPTEDRVYKDAEYRPVVTIKDNAKTLVKNTDYTVSYSNNISAGMATITIKGINNYTGTRTINFIITQRAVTIKPKDASKVYDTLPLTSNVAEVTAGDLVTGHTATITTTGSITEVGSITNTISTLIIKNASGTDVTSNYDITKGVGTLTVTAADNVDFDITLDNNTFVYDGTEKEPGVTIKVNGVTLEEGKDYDVSYKNNIKAGTATVTIKGKGNYEGSSSTKDFTITVRLLEITAGSASKVYNGTALTSSAFSITSGTSLAPNQTLSVTTSGTITNVGTTSNVIATYGIYHSGEDVKSNYNVTLKEGTLEVKPATITGSVTITGTNRVGKTLTAEVTVDPNDASLTYAWYYGTTNDINNATAIAGANTKTYSPTTDKIGMYIFVKVTASKENYNDATFTDITDNENNKVEKVGDRLTPYLMAREVQTVTSNGVTSEKAGYAIGAYRAGKTKYTSDLIKSVTIINLLETNAPTTYEAMWDASRDEDEAVYAWAVKNQTNSSMYDLYIGGEGTLVLTNGKRLFADYTKCEEINGLNKMNSTNVTDMSYMFSNLASMSTLDVSVVNTSSVTNMEGMFMTNNLTTLNVSGFDTGKVTNMSKMFKESSNITSLNINGFNTTNANNMSQMFMDCSNITSLNVSAFNTSNVTNMSAMFMGMLKLETLNVTNFNTANVTDMSSMFASCLKVQRLDLHTFNTANVTNINGMFTADSSMKSVLLGEEFNKLNGSNMFTGCSSLKAIIAQKKITASSEAMTLSATGTGLNTLTNAVLYVPNLESKGYYETATNYATVFGEARVKPILEIIGSNPVHVTVGTEYVDQGAKVAGFEESEATEYTVYGYTLSVSGLPVDTSTVGTKLVIYTVKYKDQIVVTGATW